MMKPTSLPRIALALGLSLAGVWIAGCRTGPSAFFPQPPVRSSRSTDSTPASPRGTSGHESTATGDKPKPVVANLGRQATETVALYITALTEHRFATAYDMLSKDSQRQHTRAAFEQMGKQGMPLYDPTTAKPTITGTRAVVEVQQTEDPATGSFHLIRETDAWKVVYRGGVPGMPDPSESGGTGKGDAR